MEQVAFLLETIQGEVNDDQVLWFSLKTTRKTVALAKQKVVCSFPG